MATLSLAPVHEKNRGQKAFMITACSCEIENLMANKLYIFDIFSLDKEVTTGSLASLAVCSQCRVCV